MDQPINVFIVDDEYQSRLVIVKMLARYFTDLQLLGQAGSVSEAIEGINTLQPQLIFLDVKLSGESGFDVLDRLSHTSFETIFTTGHEEYAVKAFRYSAVDYLVKPIDFVELERAVQKAVRRIRLRLFSEACQFGMQQGQATPGQKLMNKIAVPTTEGLLFIGVGDIIYCQGQGNYTEIFLSNGQKITSSNTLKSYEEMLAGRDFFRAHKSFLINLQHIEMYLRGEGGTAVMSNGREIEIARRNKASFLNLFKG